MNVAIVTARAGSKSIIDKNVYPIVGKPMVAYPIEAAIAAERIGRVFVSTDGDAIAAASKAAGAEIIERPDELGGDTINHGDVIRHAVHHVRELVEDLENVVLLLGNTVMLDGDIIDKVLAVLDERDDLDSAMTVWEAADDHPLRALQITDDGLIATYGDEPREVSTERQSYPPAYYYDQGVWAFRHSCVDRRDGPNPWWWMGKRCFPIVRPWITGRDVHGKLDVAYHEWWVQNPETVKQIKGW